MNPILEIFSQGEEIVTGQTADTNAAWLSQNCVQLGFKVTRHTAVGDNLDDLMALLNEIAERADCCICTGGLGPTVDDLTAAAVARAFSLPLQFDPVAYAQIEQFYQYRKRAMPATNRKQALLPATAERIDNEWGTAPGFSVQYRRCWFVFLPGVPFEMRHLFDEKVKPLLAQRFTLQPATWVTLKTIGIGESDLQAIVNTVILPATVHLGFRAGTEQVETKLSFPADFSPAVMAECVQNVAEAMGAYVFSIDGLEGTSGDLVDSVNALMTERQRTAVFVETASQGLLAAKCLDCQWLLESRFQRFDLADDSDFIVNAQNLAEAARQRSGADYALVQLYQGSSADFYDKNSTIILYNVLLTEHDVRYSRQTLGGPATRKQNQAALMALDLLRRYLQHHD